VIGGVAAGVARYVGLPVNLVRIALVGLTLFEGVGLFLYLAGWLLIPADDASDSRPVALTSSTPSLVAGFVVLTLGAIGLIDESWPLAEAEFIIPILLLGVGFALLNRRSDESGDERMFAGSRTQGSWPPKSQPSASNSTPTVVPVPPVDPRDVGHEIGSLHRTEFDETPPFTDTASLAEMASLADRGPFEGAGADSGPSVEEDPFGPAQDPVAGPPPWDTPDRAAPWAVAKPHGVPTRPVRTGPPVTSITLAVAAVDVGVFLVLANIARLGISATTLLGSLLVVFGAGMVASAIYGRALVLYPLSALTLVLLALAPLIDTTLSGGVGTREIRVVTEDGLEPAYSMGMGELIVDLSDLRLTSDRTVTVDVGAGYAEIEVPDDARVEVLATSRAGYVEVAQTSDEGVRNRIYRVLEGADPSAPTLTIEASATFGYVEVRRRGR